MAAMTHTPTDTYLVPDLNLTVAGEYETGRLAAAIAHLSVAGDLIRLQGELGAGKSTFCRHYLTALGHTGDVPSPTYTLVQTYADTRFPTAHVDCYRLKTPEELDGLGLDEYRRYGILLVEWPDKGGALIADGQPDLLDYHINSIENPGTLSIRFEPGETPLSRTVHLHGSPSWQRRFAMLPKLGIDTPGVILNRPVSEGGRRAFLDKLGLTGYQLATQDADWSSRSYARVTLADGTTRMLMDAPPPQEGVATYAAVADYYRSIGLHSSTLYGRDDAEGYLLTEDFGDTQLWHLLQDGTPHTDWYLAAAEGLVRQCENAPPPWARRYSPRDWWVEVVRFVNWYLPYARGRATTLDEYAAWQRLWEPLFQTVMQQPTGLMMWDCQSPNLMILGSEPALQNLGWVDIQDARVAPVAQDMALLLRNIRTPQDDARERDVCDFIANRLAIEPTKLKLAIDICSLHHSCRILGGLIRLHVRDKRIAPAKAYLARTWEVAHQSFDTPELAGIVAMMREWEAPGMARLWKETQGHDA